jgi:hypothetical protein
VGLTRFFSNWYRWKLTGCKDMNALLQSPILILTISKPSKTGELVKMADALMCSVKRGSKNAIKYATYTG